MSLVAELPSARVAGLAIAVADLGLVAGYVCVAADGQPLKYAERENAKAAIAFCAAQKHWPPATHIFCHDGPGELTALLELFDK